MRSTLLIVCLMVMVSLAAGAQVVFWANSDCSGQAITVPIPTDTCIASGGSSSKSTCGSTIVTTIYTDTNCQTASGSSTSSYVVGGCQTQGSGSTASYYTASCSAGFVNSASAVVMMFLAFAAVQINKLL